MKNFFEKLLYSALIIITTLSIIATGYQTFILKDIEAYESDPKSI